MEADQNRIEKRHAEIQAERKVLQSPEIRQLMTDVARLNRMTQLQQRQNQNEQLHLELDADATAIGSQEYHEGVVAVKKLEKQTDVTRRQNAALSQMQDAIADQEVIESQLKGDQHQREQTKRYKQKLDSEANRLARMKLNVQHLQRMKSIRDQEDEARKLEVANKLRDEVAERYIAEEGEAQANVEMLQMVNQRRRDTMNERINAGVLDAKTKKMEELLPQASNEIAQKEIEIQKLQRDAELAEQKQKSLFEQQTKVKQFEQTRNEIMEHLKRLRETDPDSRITADPSLLEVDLQMVGEEQKRYQEAHRGICETLALQHVVLDEDKELGELRQNPEAFVRHAGNLVQLRQGRTALTSNMSDIFPAVAQVQKENERKFDQLAQRERAVEERENTIDAREKLWQDQLTESRIIIQQQQSQLQNQEQQLAWYQEQSV